MYICLMVMTVGDIRKMIEGKPDNMPVYIPEEQKFTGIFYSPCPTISGAGTLQVNIEDQDQPQERDFINMPAEEVMDCLLLLPGGFLDVPDEDIGEVSEN